MKICDKCAVCYSSIFCRRAWFVVTELFLEVRKHPKCTGGTTSFFCLFWLGDFPAWGKTLLLSLRVRSSSLLLVDSVATVGRQRGGSLLSSRVCHYLFSMREYHSYVIRVCVYSPQGWLLLSYPVSAYDNSFCAWIQGTWVAGGFALMPLIFYWYVFNCLQVHWGVYASPKNATIDLFCLKNWSILKVLQTWKDMKR